MELSPVLMKRVIDKVSVILLGHKYRDTNYQYISTVVDA